jgi:hypothetical protein
MEEKSTGFLLEGRKNHARGLSKPNTEAIPETNARDDDFVAILHATMCVRLFFKKNLNKNMPKAFAVG